MRKIIFAVTVMLPMAALAQGAPSADAVMAQCNVDRGQVYQSLGAASVALGQAQQQVESLTAQLVQAKKDLAAARAKPAPKIAK